MNIHTPIQQVEEKFDEEEPSNIWELDGTPVRYLNFSSSTAQVHGRSGAVANYVIYIDS